LYVRETESDEVESNASQLQLHSVVHTIQSKMSATTTTIRSLASAKQAEQLEGEVKHYLNTEFNDLDILLDRQTSTAGPSRKKRKTLDQEIGYWESIESNASKEVLESLLSCPGMI
jgi:hypothetical protein